MSVDLLTNRKHLFEISGILCMLQKCDKRDKEADVTSYVNAVARIEIFVQKRFFFSRK